MTDRTRLKLTDERKILFDKADQIVASGPNDDPPWSDVIDAALSTLLRVTRILKGVRDENPASTVKGYCNTSVLGLRYRTSVESKWRR